MKEKESKEYIENQKRVEAENAIKTILKFCGVDIDDENFRDTPARVIKGFLHTLRGHFVNLDSELKHIFSKAFPSTYKGVIAEKNIKCFSKCPHHLETVEYVVDVGYISDKKDGKMAGLSKLPRAVKLLAQRMVLQETFTQDIVDAIMKYLNASGAMVLVKGRHNCMRCRGVEQIDCETITSSVTGVFREDIALRNEFMQLINK